MPDWVSARHALDAEVRLYDRLFNVPQPDADGDLLDMTTSRVDMAFIRGRAIDLDNMQKQLYRKYKAKYGLE